MAAIMWLCVLLVAKGVTSGPPDHQHSRGGRQAHVALLSIYTLPATPSDKYAFLTGDPLRLRDAFCEHVGWCEHVTTSYTGQTARIAADYPSLEQDPHCEWRKKHGFNDKLAAILHVMTHVDPAIQWLWVLDLDAFITNWHFDLPGLLSKLPSWKHVVASSSFHKEFRGPRTIRTCSCHWDPEQGLSTLNAGVLLVRNNAAGRNFLLRALCAQFTPRRHQLGFFVGLPRPRESQWNVDDQMLINILMEETFLDTGVCHIELLPQRILTAHYYLGVEHDACSCSRWSDGDFVLHAYRCAGVCADIGLRSAFAHAESAMMRYKENPDTPPTPVCIPCELEPNEPNAPFSEWPRIHQPLYIKYWRELASLIFIVFLIYWYRDKLAWIRKSLSRRCRFV